MSFQEKSTWVMLTTMTVVYGWYFVSMASRLGNESAGEIDYQASMLVTVLAVVGLAVALFIVLAIANPEASDMSDERDREINRFGEYVGGYVLAVGALAGLGLAMAEVEHFWVANALLAGLVVSEITSGVTKVILYRRGV